MHTHTDTRTRVQMVKRSCTQAGARCAAGQGAAAEMHVGGCWVGRVEYYINVQYTAAHVVLLSTGTHVVLLKC